MYLLGLLRQERGLAEADLAIEVGQRTHEGGSVPPFARHLSGKFQWGRPRRLLQPAGFQDPQHPAIELDGGDLPGSASIELLLPASSPAQDHDESQTDYKRASRQPYLEAPSARARPLDQPGPRSRKPPRAGGH